MICPIDVVAAFLKIAHPNTFRKVETCAILAGIEREGSLVINTLIVPPQTGKQDQCCMTDDGEIELFEAQISNSVMTLGWIHTHPQYDLFLSSVDLHNQFAYQM